MSKIKTIEGFGLPGAGKSTGISNLRGDPRLPHSIEIYIRKEGEIASLEGLHKYSNKTLEIISELYNTSFYLICRPTFFLSLIKTVYIFGLKRDFISVLRILLRALYSRSKVKNSERKRHTILLDEGLIQYLGALVVNTKTRKQLPESFIKHVLNNYIEALLYFEVDYENAIKRISKRNDGLSRIERMNNEKALLNLNKMHNTFNLCLKLSGELNIPLLILKNGNSVVENVDSALDFLIRYDKNQLEINS
jgi:thymidylate kinase